MSRNKKIGLGFIDGVTRHTDTKAVPLNEEDVSQAAVIEIKNGFFRNAEINGIFELASTQNPFYVSHKGLRVRVKCSWHSRNLLKGCLGFLLADADYSINTNYTGKVFRNLGRSPNEKGESN